MRQEPRISKSNRRTIGGRVFRIKKATGRNALRPAGRKWGGLALFGVARGGWRRRLLVGAGTEAESSHRKSADRDDFNKFHLRFPLLSLQVAPSNVVGAGTAGNNNRKGFFI